MQVWDQVLIQDADSEHNGRAGVVIEAEVGGKAGVVELDATAEKEKVQVVETAETVRFLGR